MKKILWFLFGLIAGAVLTAPEVWTQPVESVLPPQVERTVNTYPETKQWEIYIAPLNHIVVVDTAGVCLYVYMTNSITAVPKKDLLPGVGCQ